MVRRTLLGPALTALLLALTLGARSEVSPGLNTITPACISLVGTDGGVPASLGQFEVIIRDLANNPVAGATVTVDLSQATDLQLCDDQLDPSAILDCANSRVSKLTDLAGRVVFTLLGGGRPGGARTLLGQGRIYWDDRLIASPTVSTFDMDGAAGVGANDISLWLGDFGSGFPRGIGDHDCSGDLGANDLSLWLGEFGSGTQTASCAASCP